MVYILGIPFFEPEDEAATTPSEERADDEQDATAKKQGLNLIAGVMEGHGDLDDVPNVEASATFSPTGSNSVVSMSYSSDHQVVDFATTDSSFTKPINNLMVIPPPPSSSSQQYDTYMSKHELEVLLTPRCMADYEKMTYEVETTENVVEERTFRKELIHEELEYLIQATGLDVGDEEVDLTVEPEAIEALGIAANKLAYLSKFYDLASCEYLYVPSVAYTILDGSLLEEASKHYFGAAETDFLEVYADKLRSTIVRQQRLGRIMVEEEQPPKDMTEDLDLGSDCEDDDDTDIGYCHQLLSVANQVLAVSSPKNATDATSLSATKPVSSSSSSSRCFDWDQIDEEADDDDTSKSTPETSPVPTTYKRTFAVLLSLLVLAVTWSRYSIDVVTFDGVDHPNTILSTTTTASVILSTLLSPSDKKEANLPQVGKSTALSTIASSSEPTGRRGKLGNSARNEKKKTTKKPLQLPPNPKHIMEVAKKNVATNVQEDVPPHRKKAAVTSSEESAMKAFSSSPIQSQPRMRRAIVPNLLY